MTVFQEFNYSCILIYLGLILRMIRELCIGGDVKESGRGLLLGTIQMSVEKLSKIRNTSLRKAGLFAGFNAKSPEYEKEAVTTQLRCSLIKLCFEFL